MRWRAERTIDAAPERVFALMANPEAFNKAIPDGREVEYLNDVRSGVGMRLRAWRMNRGKRLGFDQEVTEFVPGQRVRMLNVTHGVLWDGVFDVRREGRGAVLSLTMDAVTRNPVVRLMNLFIHGMVQRALEKDLDAVKAYCER